MHWCLPNLRPDKNALSMQNEFMSESLVGKSTFKIFLMADDQAAPAAIKRFF